MPDFTQARLRMVERQVARRGVANVDVLNAMRNVPREAFVPAEWVQFAYDDTPLPIESGQTISQPFVVALMIEAAEVAPGHHVLEIGAGSGYAAAIMGQIAAQVHAIERHGELTSLARERMGRLGYNNVHVRTGDGTRGWPNAAPFDAIIAAAGGPAIPQVLKEQLRIGGVLVMPVGETPRVQRLMKVRRVSADHYEEEDLGPVAFVPLIGAHGWADEEEERDLLARGRVEPAKPPGPTTGKRAKS
jgi:protein-L-isoaspartate(D-aspartate) O-methyltransferase